jgi:hypothetical protein
MNMKKIVIRPGTSFKVEINGVMWFLRRINHDDLVSADMVGYHISDWAWEHAKYEALRLDTREYHWVSHFYARDIKEIMEVAA